MGLGDIRARVQARVAEELVPYLLSGVAQAHHTRRRAKGFVNGCECEFCEMKKQATVAVGMVIFPPGMTVQDLQLDFGLPNDLSTFDAWERKREIRKGLARYYRARLRAIRASAVGCR